MDLFDKNQYSRIPNTVFKSVNGIRESIREQLNKVNKDFKLYGPKSLAPVSLRSEKIKRTGVNQTAFIIGKSIPKNNLVMNKKIFSSKVIDGRTSKTK